MYKELLNCCARYDCQQTIDSMQVWLFRFTQKVIDLIILLLQEPLVDLVAETEA